MPTPKNPFEPYTEKVETEDGVFSTSEVGLANRNHGLLLETLACDVTPTGAHYLLNHFDVPILTDEAFSLRFEGAFENPMVLSMQDIRALESTEMPVTLECAGNGRAGVSPRSFSMPWLYEAAGTALWLGTPLAPLIEAAAPKANVVEVSFTGADFGFDKGEGHYFGRSLSLDQLRDLDVMLVHGMNGAPLLPQHGAPLRMIVPGWYGMASVKWLTRIEALTEPYDGFQQVRTYRFRQTNDDPGVPIQDMRVKSLMKPPGVPDWTSRRRFVEAGRCELMGRAWSGLGRGIARVEVLVGEQWCDAEVVQPSGKYAWARWQLGWDATPGEHVLRCRATDCEGNVQPLDPPWDIAGFANNAAQKVQVTVK